MPRLSITKIFSFEGAHALMNYDGLCSNIHGHSYRLEVTVTRPELPTQAGSFIETDLTDPKNGMLLDFTVLKQKVNLSIIDVFDHSLILNGKMNAEIIQTLEKTYHRIITVPYQPTSENLLLDFASRLMQVLPSHIHLKRLRLYETATSYTDWDND